MILSLWCATVSAQSINVVEALGSVSSQECTMRSYAPDPLASAVILWEQCEESVEQDILRGYLVYKTNVVRRLKIFKSSAFGYADLVMDLTDGQDLKNVTITTYNMNHGRIETTQIDKKSCIKEQIDADTQRYTYYAQKVKAGSVVELAYTLVSPMDYGPHEFDFQRSVPVNVVSYSLKIPSWLKSRKVVRGSQNVEYKVYTASEHPFDTYRATDVPAFKEESMVYCPEQYISSVHYEFQTSDAYSEYWSDVAKLLKNSPVMIQFHERTPLRKAVREIALMEMDDASKIANILSLVYAKARWNGEIGVIPYDFDLIGNPVFGNSADINSLAGAAFVEAGYEVSPVFIRPRSAGILLRDCPSADAFSTYVLHIRRIGNDGGFDAILDASNPNLYLNVLPDEFLVDSGFEVNKDGSFNWLGLTKLTRNLSNWLALAQVNPDGTMNVTAQLKNYNVSSFTFKDKYCHSTDSVLVKQVMSLIDCDNVTNIGISSFGDFQPSSYLEVEYSKQCKIDSDGSITVNPIITSFPFGEFRDEKRSLPLDFSYSETVDYKISIAFPEGGYEAVEVPQNVTFAADGVPAAVILRSSVDEKADKPAVTVMLRFVNEAMTISPEQYPALREMFVKAADNLAGGKIVFRKKD